MNRPSQNSSSLSKRSLEEAWICLLGFYGRSFEAQYGSIDGEQFQLWFAGLCSNGVTDEMVAAAARAVAAEHAHKSTHPPNFADFLRLCEKSRANDLLSEDGAFAEACVASRAWNRHVWSSGVVYHAAVAVGAWSLRQYPEKITRPRFGDAYRSLLERQRAGEVLTAAPIPTPADRQAQILHSDSQSKSTARRPRLAALSKALLELPDHLQPIATDALKKGRFVDIDELLPEGTVISAASRAVLLEFCCNVLVDPQRQAEESMFTPPSL
jgi:hypothetical protein